MSSYKFKTQQINGPLVKEISKLVHRREGGPGLKSILMHPASTYILWTTITVHEMPRPDDIHCSLQMDGNSPVIKIDIHVSYKYKWHEMWFLSCSTSHAPLQWINIKNWFYVHMADRYTLLNLGYSPQTLGTFCNNKPGISVRKYIGISLFGVW